MADSEQASAFEQSERPPGDSLGGNADPQGWLLPVEVERNIAELVRASQPRIYAAPRRFDLPTIFVVTTAYAILFAAAQALDWVAAASAGVAGFLTVIGISQALLFGGKRPREASIVAGAVMLPAATLVTSLFRGVPPHPGVIFVIMCTALSGGMLGYFAGAIVGGVFLVADMLRGRFSHWGSD